MISQEKTVFEQYSFSRKCWEGPCRDSQLTILLVRFFDVAINLEGFWNNDQMTLQVEDVYNVLSKKIPHYDFLMLLDQNSGHGRMREGSLNVNVMNLFFWGKQGNLTDIEIKEIGTY